LRQIEFEVVAECARTHARAGLLHTGHGVIETPVFMPVGTQATVKGLSSRDLAEDLACASCWPTRIIFICGRGRSDPRAGWLHRFMDWPHAILTDSGGFQVFSLSGLRKIDEDGVTFQSH